MSIISIKATGFTKKVANQKINNIVASINRNRAFIFIEPLQDFLEAVKLRILEGSEDTLFTHNYTGNSYKSVYTKFEKTASGFTILPGIHTEYTKLFAEGTPAGTVIPLAKMISWAKSKSLTGEDAQKFARKVKKDIEEDGSGAYPIVEDLWEIYSAKYHAEVKRRLREFVKRK